MKLVARGLESAQIDALLEFHTSVYGRDAYQSARHYVDWLYLDNPAARGLQDCIVLLDEHRIVGCVHRMRLPCAGGAEALTLASLQNHVVSPELRGGAGIALLQRAVRGERITLSPGVHGRLREAYRRLGYVELPSYWLTRVSNPLRAASQAAFRALPTPFRRSAHLRVKATLFAQWNTGPLRVTIEPEPAQLQRLADALVAQARRHPGAYVPWDTQLLRWRYFSPSGPRHVLIERPRAGAWAVISCGVRSNLNVVRLLEHDLGTDPTFLRDVTRVASRLGAGVSLAFTPQAQVRDRLIEAGWRLRSDPPSSFTQGDGVAISAAATDVGLESLLTEIVQ